MHMITLEIARKIADAAMAEALKRNVTKAAVVVTDMGGDIRIAMRSDAAGAFGVVTARGKAQAALGFNLSSLKLAEIFGTSASATAAINAATGGRFVPLGGGVLVVNSEGHIIGAAALSGGLPAVDDEIITAAVRAAGLAVPS
jgi:uncharacterized protein GlcG (DUF336 family)